MGYEVREHGMGVLGVASGHLGTSPTGNIFIPSLKRKLVYTKMYLFITKSVFVRYDNC